MKEGGCPVQASSPLGIWGGDRRKTSLPALQHLADDRLLLASVRHSASLSDEPVLRARATRFVTQVLRQTRAAEAHGVREFLRALAPDLGADAADGDLVARCVGGTEGSEDVGLRCRPNWLHGSR